MLDVLEQSLPLGLWMLSEEIGMEAVISLVDAFGGRRKYVPQTMRPDHEIAQLIGYERACTLSQIYGGSRLWLWNKWLPVARRNYRILQDSKSLTCRQLAAKYGLTERQIYSILKEYTLEPERVAADD